MLEVIDKGASTKADPTPLLFAHGGCHAAWCARAADSVGGRPVVGHNMVLEPGWSAVAERIRDWLTDLGCERVKVSKHWVRD